MTVSDGVSPSPKGGPEPVQHPSKSANGIHRNSYKTMLMHVYATFSCYCLLCAAVKEHHSRSVVVLTPSNGFAP